MQKLSLISAVTLLSLLVCLPASAQNKEKGVFVEMNFGYCESRVLVSGGNPGESLPYEHYMIYTPAVGYQINNRWAVGLKAQFERKSYKFENQYNAMSIYGQYRFFNRKWLKLFVEGSISHGFVDKDQSILYPRDYTEAGFNLGVAVPIYRGLSFMARYLHVGYSDVEPVFRRDFEGSAYWGDGNWVVDGNLRRLSIGLQYRF